MDSTIGFPLIFHGSKAMGVKFVPELMRIGTHTYCPKLERINCKSGNSIVGNETDTLPLRNEFLHGLRTPSNVFFAKFPKCFFGQLSKLAE